MIWVNRSYSTVEVRLKSPDPSIRPDVDFDMCSDSRDLERLVMATRMAVKQHHHKMIRDAVHEISPSATARSRARSLSIAHGTSFRLGSGRR